MVRIIISVVRFLVITAVLLTIRAFVDITPCRLEKYLATLKDRCTFIVEDLCLPLLALCGRGFSNRGPRATLFSDIR
jgi:hypothetical protein